LFERRRTCRHACTRAGIRIRGCGRQTRRHGAVECGQGWYIHADLAILREGNERLRVDPGRHQFAVDEGLAIDLGQAFDAVDGKWQQELLAVPVDDKSAAHAVEFLVAGARRVIEGGRCVSEPARQEGKQ